MHIRNQRILAWSLPLYLLLGFIGWAMADFFPPPSPELSPAANAAFYQHDTNLFRAGIVVLMFSGPLWGTFAVAVSAQMKRIEGARAPLSAVQSGIAWAEVAIYLLGMAVMVTAAFRPFRDPQITQLATDFGFLLALGMVVTAYVHFGVIALAIFQDHDQRVFPRWLGYLNVATLVIMSFGVLSVFFKDGPFAHDGFITMYVISGVVISAWMIAMFFMVLRAINSEAAEDAARERGDIDVPMDLTAASPTV